MAVVIRLVTLVFVFLVAQSRAQDLKQEPPCVCMWFYLCTEGTVNQDGTGIIEPRSSFNVTCNGPGLVCCLSGQSESSSAPILESTTPPIEGNETVLVETSTEPDSGVNEPDPGVNEPDPNTPIVFEDVPEAVAYPVFAPKAGCGVKRVQIHTRKRTPEIQQRISFSSLDESIAQYAEFPWMLAILNDEYSTGQFECGASLIHKQVALTAAHCVDRLSVNTMRIRAGEWNFMSTEEPEPYQERLVSRIELHPFYDRVRMWQDIALIFLESPFNITDNVDTICLPEQNSIFHGLRCTVTGWGKDTNTSIHGTYSNILRKVEVPVVPFAECQTRLRETGKLGPFYELDDSFMCAGGEPDRDSCKGDGGGPLICSTDEENRWVQAGIVSWGIGCGSTIPGVYTDVSRYTKWIYRHLRDFEHVPHTNPFFFPPSYLDDYYPDNIHDLPDNDLDHYFSNPHNHYPSNPHNHYPSNPHNHYPSNPHNHYPSNPHNHYHSNPHEHYPSDPYNQYPSDPYDQYPSDPYNQYPSDPYNEYPSDPYN